MSDEIATTGQRQGPHRVGPDDGVKFTPEYQPSAEAKKEGWAKKKMGRELVKAILQRPFVGNIDSALKKDISVYFGVSEEEITLEMMMHFRQAEKAIKKTDTQAYNALMDRAHGLPKSNVKIEAEVTTPLQPTEVSLLIAELRALKQEPKP